MLYSLAGALGVRVRQELLAEVQATVQCAIRELETPPPQVAFLIHIGGTAPLDRHIVRAIVEDLAAGVEVTEVRMLKGHGAGTEGCLRSSNDTDASAMYGVSAIVDSVSSLSLDHALPIPQSVDFQLPSGYAVPLSLAMCVLPNRARPRVSVPLTPPSRADVGASQPSAEGSRAPSPSVSMPPTPSFCVDAAVALPGPESPTPPVPQPETESSYVLLPPVL